MEKSKKSIGIVKRVDMLGRVCIPKCLRERYALDGEVELVATTEGVLIRNARFILMDKKGECEEP